MHKSLLLGAFTISMILAGCGQSGPLYIPADKTPTQTPTARTSPAPSHASPGKALPQYTLPIGS